MIDGQRVKVHLFQLRLCHSGRGVRWRRFCNETQQAFLEGHADAFEFLGGVPALVRYDNLASAVKQVLKGRRRVETDRFVGVALALPVRVAVHAGRPCGARMRRAASRARSAGSVAATSSPSRPSGALPS